MTFNPTPVSCVPAGVPAHLGRYQLRSALGSGSTSAVYLAYDEELQRTVAVKVIHPQLLASDQAAEMFLREARNLARLDHPGIVPVYDTGRADGGFFYIVFKYIDGNDLKRRMAEGRVGWNESATLIAAVAEALHHAHECGLVHRDIKPANIMLDRDGRPIVADFGIALTREAFGTGPAFVGTPSYMSPEQARRESHRVDARTDIYGLGAVLYELLVGRPPFQADTRDALLDQIKQRAPTPPCELDPAIPAELERICLKALSKRAADRHASARDLADDLKAWLRESQMTDSASKTEAAVPVPSPSSSNPRLSGLGRGYAALPIVPRLAPPFAREDGDFFLALLPGPRDRDGLPESVAFWKRRIDSTDAERAFRVGLLYGPSGGGKSSLVRAGLLPHLGPHITAFVEADARETESRLLHHLQRHCPRSARTEELPGRSESGGERSCGRPETVIVLDQFEQWLHAAHPAATRRSSRCVRQCDGTHVQCLLLRAQTIFGCR